MEPLNVDLSGDTPEAKRANELARELVTARTFAMPAGSSPETEEFKAFVAALERVLIETFSVDEDQLPARVAYLAAALSQVAAAAVSATAFTLGQRGEPATIEIPDHWTDRLPEALRMMTFAAGALDDEVPGI